MKKVIYLLVLLAVGCSKDDDIPIECPCQNIIIEGRNYTFPFCSEEEREAWQNATTKEAELRASRNECD